MRKIVTVAGIVAAFCIFSLDAQGRGQAPSSPGLVLKDVLYDASDTLGMLRGIDEEDAVVTLEHWASGRGSSGEQPYDISSYRASYNFKDVNGPGVRVDITRVGADGKPVREIQVVSGEFAWNETAPGVNPTRAQDSLNERLLRFWSHPFTVVKMATVAGQMTKASVEAGAIILTFPLPLSGATLKATLNPQYQSERVEARIGNIVLETTYSDYRDWNWPDYQSDVMTPGRIVQRQNGVTILDLTTKETNTYNPYVILTVPRQFLAGAPAFK